MDEIQRCFGNDDPLMEKYHDEEWGVPVRDDRLLFEHLLLDSFQAGLSWRTILHKRENFRSAFHGFDPESIATYNDQDRERLMADAGIIRNKLKINAAITNAQAYLEIMNQPGSFSDFLWSFTEGTVYKGPLAKTWQEIPTSNPESEAMSKALKAHGFKFVGSTICYAFMQAVGIIDDHLVDCFRFSGR